MAKGKNKLYLVLKYDKIKKKKSMVQIAFLETNI